MVRQQTFLHQTLPTYISYIDMDTTSLKPIEEHVLANDTWAFLKAGTCQMWIFLDNTIKH